MKAIRTFTICHNDDDANDPKHRRVKINLTKTERGYEWFCEDEETESGYYKTVDEACDAAVKCWGAGIWAMRAKWLQ